MLNTFENAERHQLRRKERERHMRTIDTVIHPLSDYNLAPAAADALVGVPLVKRPSMRSVQQSYTPEESPRRKRKYLYIAAAGIIIVVVMATLLGLNVGDSHDGGSDSGLQLQRKHRLIGMILDWGVTPLSILEDKNTAAGQALNWLAFVDTDTENPETIRTRYSLATLYFSVQTSMAEMKHWLSSYPVCLWHGVECLDENDTLGLVKSVNLSSNALTGTLPGEISLLQLDIRSLDVSGNKIGGSIPDLSPLKNLQHLYLGPNKFSGTLPPKLHLLSHLTHFYLNDCSLTGTLPTTVGELTKLQGLGLHNNFFSGTREQYVLFPELPTSIRKLGVFSVSLTIYLSRSSHYP